MNADEREQPESRPLDRWELHLLEMLSKGRGLHAALAWRKDDVVTIYRSGRFQKAFPFAVVERCITAGWVRYYDPTGRFTITPAGRAKIEENPR